jgi:deoxyguanosine kinase
LNRVATLEMLSEKMSGSSVTSTVLRRIEICGGIATGKTTLAKRLHEVYGIGLFLEPIRTVPFWQEFYSSSGREYPFGKNLGFMLFHAHRIVRAGSSPFPAVCDFAFFQNCSYVDLSYRAEHTGVVEDATLKLEDGTLKDVYHRFVGTFAPPSVIIDINCPPEVQFERIQNRIVLEPGRGPERSITQELLCKQRSIIDEWRKVEEFRGVPFISVDSAGHDFRTDDGEVVSIWSDLERATNHQHAP